MPERFAIMRHDIDRRAGRALDTARIEQELGERKAYAQDIDVSCRYIRK